MTYIPRQNRRPPPKRPTREGEIKHYVALYEHDNYGMGAKRRAAVREIVGALEPGSLLDVSTGRGETLRFASDAGHRAFGTEVVPGLCGAFKHAEKMLTVVWAQAHALPYEEGEFDHVTCFDVLEHLIEEDVRACLAEMRRVARKSVTASASERPSVFGGRDLHISKRPAAEWEVLMREVWGGATRIQDAGGSPCWQWHFKDK